MSSYLRQAPRDIRAIANNVWAQAATALVIGFVLFVALT